MKANMRDYSPPVKNTCQHFRHVANIAAKDAWFLLLFH